MKIQSKFAILITLASIALIGFTIYFYGIKYKDVSQLIIFALIGCIGVIYAREVWNRSKSNGETTQYREEHTAEHIQILKTENQILEEISNVRLEYNEIKQLGNDMRLDLFESKN